MKFVLLLSLVSITAFASTPKKMTGAEAGKEIMNSVFDTKIEGEKCVMNFARNPETGSIFVEIVGANSEIGTAAITIEPAALVTRTTSGNSETTITKYVIKSKRGDKHPRTLEFQFFDDISNFNLSLNLSAKKEFAVTCSFQE